MGGNCRCGRRATAEPLERRAMLSVTGTSTDTTPPRITDVFVGSTAWTANFRNFLQSSAAGSSTHGFRIDAAAQTDELPWTNVNRISVRFSEDVNVALHDLVVRGGDLPVHDFADADLFTYDPASFTATWTLAANVRNDKLLLELSGAPNGAGVADRAGNSLDGEWTNPVAPSASGDAYPSGDGAAGGDFNFRLNVLPGDVNRSGGSVVGSDVTLVRNSQNFSPGSSGYSIFRDVNGSGSILGSDVTLVRNAQGTRVPAYEVVPLTAVRVNAGGAAFTDSIGRAFEADVGFAGGTVNAATYDVLNTTDDALYGPHRAGASFTFTRPVANGNYVLLLGFAEPDGAVLPGRRKFDVTAEGQLVADDVDVAAAAGAARTAVAKSANVLVTDGQLDLAFTGVAGEAIVSYVVLIPSDIPAVAYPYSLQNASDGARGVVAASNLRNIGMGMIFYANENRGSLPPDLQTIVGHVEERYSAFTSPRTDTLLPRGELLPVERRAWVAATDDFLYTGAGQRLGRIPGSSIIAYENPARVAGGLYMLRADGSVGFYERAQAAELVPMPPDEPTPPVRPVKAKDPDISLSATRLRTIGVALFEWANVHSGRFPTTWGTPLHLGEQVPVETFINPRTGTQPPPADWTPEQKAAWVDATTDFVFAAPGVRYSQLDAIDLLAYENPANMKGGINLLFARADVEFRETRWATETIRAWG